MNAELQPFHWKDRWVWMPPLLAAGLALLLVGLDANRSLFLVLNGLPRHTGDLPWALLTLLGDHVAALTLALPILLWRPRLALGIVLAALLTWAGSKGLKNLFDAPRPVAVLGVDAVHVIGPVLRRHAFPSGHTMVAFTLAGLLVLPSGADLRRRWGPLVLGLALLAGVSRCAVGAHWPADVLAGATLGWLCALVGQWVATRRPVPGEGRTVRVCALVFAGFALALPFRDTGFEGLHIWQGMLALVCLGHAAAGRLQRFAP